MGNEATWIRQFPAAITVCDRQGTILAMNDRSADANREEGGLALIGTNLYDCHPEPARSKLRSLLESGSVNCYTIEKAGQKKMIFQSPWYESSVYTGFVEISMPIPSLMPHFIRDAPAKA
jgi:hypothetical protein